MKLKSQIPNLKSHNSSEEEKQLKYLNARTSDWYDDIWKNVGKCVFCDLKDKYIIHEENDIVLTISLYPYIDGHMMIIPRQHVKSPKDLSDIQWETVRKFTYLAKKMIRKVHGIKAMQIVYKDGISAQGTVNGHLHLHCIPFDAVDLSIWNYRELKNTPLANANKYKELAPKIIKYDSKFQEKYDKKTLLPVVCDLIIINKKKQVLFQERADEYKFDPDILTLPGGHLDNPQKGFIEELGREVEEEVFYKIDSSKVVLVDSRFSQMDQPLFSKHLQMKKITKMQFTWNTYLLTEFDETQELKPQDDCKDLVWIDLKSLKNHPRVTADHKKVIAKALKSKLLITNY